MPAPKQVEIDYSAQASVNPLEAFAAERQAPAPEHAGGRQRLMMPRRRHVPRRRPMRVYGLVVLTVVGLFAIALLKFSDDEVVTRPEALRVRVEDRTVLPPAAVTPQQEIDGPRVAGITGTSESIPETADALPRLAKAARSPKVQAPAPQSAARTVARVIVPQTVIATTPLRPAAPDEDPPHSSVTAPLVTAARDPVPPASPSPPVPAAVAPAREAPVAPRGEPVAVAPAPPPTVSVAPPSPARGGAERAAVEAVLGQYASAFSAMDARRAKAVWPTVNERNLERAFDSLEQQEFDLGACDITVLPPRALALCDGTARYTPKVGNRKTRTESRRWSFALRQTSQQEWAIETVNLR